MTLQQIQPIHVYPFRNRDAAIASFLMIGLHGYRDYCATCKPLEGGGVHKAGCLLKSGSEFGLRRNAEEHTVSRGGNWPIVKFGPKAEPGDTREEEEPGVVTVRSRDGTPKLLIPTDAWNKMQEEAQHG